MKRIPKLRGRGNNKQTSIQQKPAAVNLATLADVYASGDEVTPTTLIEYGVVTARAGRAPRVKILANGDLNKKLTIHGCAVSATARKKIEKAGGSVERS